MPRKKVETIAKTKILKAEMTMLEKIKTISESPKVDIYIHPNECKDWYLDANGCIHGNVMLVSINGFTMYLEPGKNSVPLCVEKRVWEVRQNQADVKKIAERPVIDPITRQPQIKIRKHGGANAAYMTNYVREKAAEINESLAPKGRSK